MSDNNWRIKTYYPTRVLIETGHILDCPFPDALLCLEGHELALLRNLAEYLHRRSTFVSEYHLTYYMAPSNEEWDTLQALVATLEDKLMNCTQYDALLQQILAAAQCACEGSGAGYTDATTSPIYDNLEDEGTIAWVKDDGTPSPAEGDECQLAQLVWAMNYDILTEYVQPLQSATHSVLLFLVLEGLAVWLGGPAALVPGTALYLAITRFLDAWVEGELNNVETELLAKKEQLVCAMYNSFLLEEDYGQAAAAAAAVIDASETWSAIDKALFKATFAPWVMKMCQTAMTAETDWASSNYSPGYCWNCDYVFDHQGTDWFSIKVDGPAWTIHTTQGANHFFCWPDVDTGGYTICGAIVEVVMEKSGYFPHNVDRRSVSTCDKTGDNMFQQGTSQWSSGTKLWGNFAYVTESEILAYYGIGGATPYNHYRVESAKAQGTYFLSQGNPTCGYCDTTVKYLIFEGTKT